MKGKGRALESGVCVLMPPPPVSFLNQKSMGENTPCVFLMGSLGGAAHALHCIPGDNGPGGSLPSPPQLHTLDVSQLLCALFCLSQIYPKFFLMLLCPLPTALLQDCEFLKLYSVL